jgi:hypothetical protein
MQQEQNGRLVNFSLQVGYRCEGVLNVMFNRWTLEEELQLRKAEATLYKHSGKQYIGAAQVISCHKIVQCALLL